MEYPKPKLRFCWMCGKQLYGNHHQILTIDDHKRILHVSCANNYMKDNRVPWDEYPVGTKVITLGDGFYIKELTLWIHHKEDSKTAATQPGNDILLIELRRRDDKKCLNLLNK